VVFVSATLTERLLGFARSFLGEAEVEQPAEHEIPADELLLQVEEARKEWLAARSYFDNATDSALIDHAVFSLQAAERKYVYLLSQAKRRGVRNEAYWFMSHHRIE
jgi:hypothetical protein